MLHVCLCMYVYVSKAASGIKEHQVAVERDYALLIHLLLS